MVTWQLEDVSLDWKWKKEARDWYRESHSRCIILHRLSLACGRDEGVRRITGLTYDSDQDVDNNTCVALFKHIMECCSCCSFLFAVYRGLADVSCYEGPCDMVSNSLRLLLLLRSGVAPSKVSPVAVYLPVIPPFLRIINLAVLPTRSYPLPWLRYIACELLYSAVSTTS
jgi:hypothetical protein